MNRPGSAAAFQQALQSERRLALVFALLGTFLTLLMTAYWFLVQEPALHIHAESHSHALAQAQALGIERLLRDRNDPQRLLNDIQTELDAILLLRDRSAQQPFIRRITVALNQELYPTIDGSSNVERGENTCCPECFTSEVPLYQPRNRLLIGVATFCSSPEFLQNLANDIRGKLLWVGGATLCLIAFAWIGASRLLRRLGASEAKLHRASITDGLTDLFNRRYIYPQLSREIDRATTLNDSLSIILFDLDGFKQINDTFGHGVGDDVLIATAAALKASVRDTDIVGRYGGEEFLIILPHSEIRQATQVAERARIRIKSLEWPDPRLRITISGGVCEHKKSDVDSFIEEADSRLYDAKKAGRDRIVA